MYEDDDESSSCQQSPQETSLSSCKECRRRGVPSRSRQRFLFVKAKKESKGGKKTSETNGSRYRVNRKRPRRDHERSHRSTHSPPFASSSLYSIDDYILFDYVIRTVNNKGRVKSPLPPSNQYHQGCLPSHRTAVIIIIVTFSTPRIGKKRKIS